MVHTGTLQSLQVGSPQSYAVTLQHEDGIRRWETSFFRSPDPRPRWLYTTHLEGNEQGDKKNHGQPDQAVLLYSAQHYPVWQQELSNTEIGPGAFGENFTVADLSEWTACVGDIYSIGSARIQVTGPRYPCWKIEQRWGIAGLTARVAATGRTGWYCRVLQEGLIEPGLPINIVERPYPQWTMALINDFGHARNRDRETAQALASCSLLSSFWQKLVLRQALNVKHFN